MILLSYVSNKLLINIIIMKKFIFLVSITMLVLASCSSKPSSAAPQKEEDEEEITLKSGSCLILRSSTKDIKIRFKEGESPFFDHYMLTGEPDDRQVVFAFYKAEDVTKDGHIVKGKHACRLFIIQLPHGEIAEEWGAGQLVTIREDGTRHVMKYVLVDQPPFD